MTLLFLVDSQPKSTKEVNEILSGTKSVIDKSSFGHIKIWAEIIQLWSQKYSLNNFVLEVDSGRDSAVVGTLKDNSHLISSLGSYL